MTGPNSKGTKTYRDNQSGKSARYEKNKTARRLFNEELSRVQKGTNHTNIGFLVPHEHFGGLVKVDKNWTKSSRRQSKRRH
jgi:hypothetical protein